MKLLNAFIWLTGYTLEIVKFNCNMLKMALKISRPALVQHDYFAL